MHNGCPLPTPLDTCRLCNGAWCPQHPSVVQRHTASCPGSHVLLQLLPPPRHARLLSAVDLPWSLVQHASAAGAVTAHVLAVWEHHVPLLVLQADRQA